MPGATRRLGGTWAVTVLAAPVLVFPPRGWWGGAVVVAVWCAGRLARSLMGRRPSTVVDLPIALLLTSMAVSVWAAPALMPTLPKVSGVLFGVLVCWSAADLAAVGRARAVELALVGAAAALALVSLVGTQWQVKFSAWRPVVEWFPVRFAGLPGAADGFSPNPVAATMAVLLPLIVWWAGGSGQAAPGSSYPWSRGLGVAAALLAAGVVVLSQSRGAWLGLAVAMCVRAALVAPVRSRGVVVAVAVAASGLGLVALVAPDLLSVARDGHWFLGGRLELWDRGLAVIAHFPATGLGPNIFRQVMPVVYPSFLGDPTWVVPHVHNGLLQVAVDIGVPGLIAWTSLWTVAVRRLLARARTGGFSAEQGSAAALVAGVVSTMVFEITDAIPLGAKVGVVWWAVCGLAAGQARTTTSASLVRDAALYWATAASVAVALTVWSPLVAVLAAVTGGVMIGRFLDPAHQVVR
jgi:putative inorganic carbon (hco3(-)) transporter